MSDSKLRDLERRCRQTNSQQDEATYLRERVRVGDLAPERLELAAYLGHPAALLLLGGSREGWANGQDLHAWLRGLLQWRSSVVLLAYISSFRLLPGHDDPLYEEAQTEIRAWLEQGAKSPSPVRSQLYSPAFLLRRARTPAAHVLCKSLNVMTGEVDTLSPYYLREDEPERARSARRAPLRGPPSSGGRWQYSYTYRGEDRWWHRFHGQIDPRTGAASSHLIEAARGWSLHPHERTTPRPGERSPLDEFGVTFELIELDQATPGRVAREIGAALIPWALRPCVPTGPGPPAAPAR